MSIQRAMLVISRTCITTIKNVKHRGLQLYFWWVKTGKYGSGSYFGGDFTQITTLVNIDGSMNSDTHQVFQPKTWLPLPGGHSYNFRSDYEPNVLLNQNRSASRKTKPNVLQLTFQSRDVNPTEKPVVRFEMISRCWCAQMIFNKGLQYCRKCCYSL